MNNWITVQGQLGTRLANSEAIAERVGHSLQSIATLNPLFNNWAPHDSRRHRSTLPATLTWPPQQAELRVLINEGAIFESRKGRKAHVGYGATLWTPENDSIQVNFWLRVDFTDGAWWFLNRVGITFFVPGANNIWVALQRIGQNPITFSRLALLDLATTWDCDWAGALAGDYSEKAPNPPHVPIRRYKSGWMVYLDGAHAAHVGEAGVKVERLSGGGALFTTVADKNFDGGNADHLAAARRLQTALAPLNEIDSNADK
jgi:hypothetical protein